MNQINETEDMKLRYSLSKTIRGTRSYHSVVPTDKNGRAVELRLFSLSPDFITHTLGVMDIQQLQLSVGRHIAVCINLKWQIGEVVLQDEGDILNGDVAVSFYTRVRRWNKLRKPPIENIQYVPQEWILCNVDQPTLTDDDHFCLQPVEFKIVDRLCKEYERNHT